MMEMDTDSEPLAAADRRFSPRLPIHLPVRYVPTESELERLLFSVVDNPSIPPPKRQVRLDWWSKMPHRVDALIVPWSLILEADGRPFHTKRADFERDRRRDNLAVANGYRVMRLTYQMLTREPRAVREQIIAAGAHI